MLVKKYGSVETLSFFLKKIVYKKMWTITDHNQKTNLTSMREKAAFLEIWYYFIKLVLHCHCGVYFQINCFKAGDNKAIKETSVEPNTYMKNNVLLLSNGVENIH